MNGLPPFEEQLEDWLEDGPADAPDRVLRTVLGAFPSIPQRRAAWRGPWRFLPMNGYIRALAAVVAAVAVIAVGFAFARLPSTGVSGASTPSLTPSLVVSPSPRPSPSPGVSPSPVAIDTSAWKTYTSPRYGLSVRHPVGWVEQPATASWPAGADLEKVAPRMLDRLPSTPDGLELDIASQRLKPGTTEAAWLSAYEATGAADDPPDAACWPAPQQMDRLTVGGQPAWVHGGCGFNEAVTFAGGRVYVITLWADAYFDYPLFRAVLSTVVLEPAKGG